MDKNDFYKALEDKGLGLSEQQKQQFAYYYYFLISENQKYNLTSLVLEGDVYEKHFYDSLSLMFEEGLDGAIIDVGSGGGFPGLPLKIVNPKLDLTILDATNKKIDYINLLSSKLKLAVKMVCTRAEEHTGKYDVVLARGVASLNVLLELCCGIIKDNGVLIAMKGSKYQEELDEAKNAMKLLGFELVKTYSYVLPSNQDKRCNLYFKKIRKHGSKYPRAYSKIKKQPL